MRSFMIIGGLLSNATASFIETRGLEVEDAKRATEPRAADGASFSVTRSLIHVPIDLHSVIYNMNSDFMDVESLFNEGNESNGELSHDGTMKRRSSGIVPSRPLEFLPEDCHYKSLHNLFSQQMDRLDKIEIIAKLKPFHQLQFFDQYKLTLYRKYHYQLTSLKEIYASDYFAWQYFERVPPGTHRSISEEACRPRLQELIDLRDNYKREMESIRQTGVQFHRISQQAFNLGKVTLLAITIPLLFSYMSDEQITLVEDRASAYVQELRFGTKGNIHSIYGILTQVVRKLYKVNRYIQTASSLTTRSSIQSVFVDWTTALDEINKLESKYIPTRY